MLAKKLLQAIDQVMITADKPGQRINESGEMLCFYCGSPLETIDIDHVTPRKLGGVDRGFNRVISCLHCNRTKNGKHPVYWLMQSLEDLPDEQMLDYLARYLYHSLVKAPVTEPAWPAWEEIA